MALSMSSDAEAALRRFNPYLGGAEARRVLDLTSGTMLVAGRMCQVRVRVRVRVKLATPTPTPTLPLPLPLTRAVQHGHLRRRDLGVLGGGAVEEVARAPE